ncbi:MAG TPA: tRNA pseudouridine(55) synthase TruB [Ignavibacteriaceae bacterium]|jgi:tRNA pseudouridine55 synthase|nr:MAG: tRNA pseudouridine synthase B [Ignavibacteria bacterium ADurb.Bin266]OQY75972.1 MAG: tRNA pseudouridine(55) synthase TruB [Ignavibacteriales bacterium UTCHB2]HQF41395.1 tRNA pseudouridine(55) synthase TruB [Ignavibacteriaceae bacterium]HQI41082.1 tRNA pseudouridine(55) synthase TruB [Ignavibacteriaceae bacterium]HQJ46948.1 tRNA pseudouridine(55) synthase TruB [Ignavibacteriaceae bacterium]
MIITKQTKDLQNLDYLSGQVILIDKPVNWTSFDVVAKIRRLTKVKKVGHAGTLDPLATGLLIICTGKKTKEISDYQEQRKKYSGIITLGKSSPSMDLATELTEKELPDNLTEERILEVRNKFLGKIEQVPPMFSAIKHKGKALYKFARAGREVERKPKQVEIFSFEILNIDLPDIHFEISCSKGTYIRVIANDFGNEVDCGGVLSLLRRTEIGEYKVDDAYEMSEFSSMFKDDSKRLT